MKRRIEDHPVAGFIDAANNFDVLKADGAPGRLVERHDQGGARTRVLRLPLLAPS